MYCRRKRLQENATYPSRLKRECVSKCFTRGIQDAALICIRQNNVPNLPMVGWFIWRRLSPPPPPPPPLAARARDQATLRNAVRLTGSRMRRRYRCRRQAYFCGSSLSSFSMYSWEAPCIPLVKNKVTVFAGVREGLWKPRRSCSS